VQEFRQKANGNRIDQARYSLKGRYGMESTDVASTLKEQEVLLNLALHTAVELLVEKESARRIRSAGFCGCLPSWWQSASRSGFCGGIGGPPPQREPLTFIHL
jgi:hypothetical protein